MNKVVVAWFDSSNLDWYQIGILSFVGDRYQFFYLDEVDKAFNNPKFSLIYSFPNLYQTYSSAQLFPFFTNRIMNPNRPEYSRYLNWLGLDSTASPIDILSRSGGTKVTDFFEVFSYPKLDSNSTLSFIFPVVGVKPYVSTFRELNKLNPGDELNFSVYPLRVNSHFIASYDGVELGYFPNFLSHLLSSTYPNHIKLSVFKINPFPTSLQFKLLCEISIQFHINFVPFSRSYHKITP